MIKIWARCLYKLLITSFGSLNTLDACWELANEWDWCILILHACMYVYMVVEAYIVALYIYFKLSLYQSSVHASRQLTFDWFMQFGRQLEWKSIVFRDKKSISTTNYHVLSVKIILVAFYLRNNISPPIVTQSNMT